MVAKIERLTITEPYLSLGCILAEGPFYRAEDDTFHFIDIKGKMVYQVPLSGSPPPRALATEDMLGVACLIEGNNDNYIVAAKKGIGLVNQQSGELKYLVKMHQRDGELEKRFGSL
jgi:sugar lactone lactonase YvrE